MSHHLSRYNIFHCEPTPNRYSTDHCEPSPQPFKHSTVNQHPTVTTLPTVNHHLGRYNTPQNMAVEPSQPYSSPNFEPSPDRYNTPNHTAVAPQPLQHFPLRTITPKVTILLITNEWHNLSQEEEEELVS